MPEDRKKLLQKLAKAQQRLQQAQAQVTQLEAELSPDPAPTIGATAHPSFDQPAACQCGLAPAQQAGLWQQAELAQAQYVQRLEILHEIDQGLLAGRSIETLIESTLHHLRQLINCQRASVLLLDATQKSWSIFAVDHTVSTRLGKGVSVPIPQTGFASFDQEKLQLIPDLQMWSEADAPDLQLIKEGIRSSLRVLLTVQDQPLGMLSLSAEQPHFFTGEHQALAKQVANQLAIAIHQRILAEAVAHHNQELAQQLRDLTHKKQELGQREERYRRVIEDQLDVICRFDRDFRLTFVNQAYSALFGKQPDAMIGLSVLDGVPIEYQAQVVTNIAMLNSANPVVNADNPLFLQDGTERWFHWTNRVVTDETTNQMVEYQGVGRDITDERNLQLAQQRHAQAVEEMRQFLQSTLDASAASKVVLARDGTIININATWKRLCLENGATSPSCFLGENYLAVCDRSAQLDSADAALAAAGIRAVIDGRAPDFYLEYTLEGPTQLQWFRLRVTPFAEPAPRRVVVSHDNITQRRAAEEAERAQRHFAEALLNSLAALTGSLDVESVLQQILQSVAAVVPSEAGSIILFEENEGRVAYLRGFAPEAAEFFSHYRFPLDSATVGSAIANKEPYFIPDTREAENWIALPVTAWIHSSLGIPIEIRGETIGLLVIDSATPNHFQRADMEKLLAFARYASLALENAYHATQLEQRVIQRTTELQSAKEQVEAILDNSLDGILLVRPDLQIEQANTAFTKLFACPRHACLNRPLLQFIHEADRDRMVIILLDTLASQTGQQVELRARRHDGSLFDAELSIGQVQDDGLVCTIRDVTTRRQHERQLRYYASLQENVSDAVISTDMELRIQSWNRAAEEIYGWTAEEAMGQPLTRFLRSYYSSPDKYDRAWQALLREGHWHGEIRHHRKDGTALYVLSSISVLYDDDRQAVGIVAVNYDISERKEAEDALEASRRFAQQIAENVPNIIYIYDEQAQRYTYINRNSLTVLGYTPQEVSDMHLKAINDIIHPADADIYRQHGQQLMVAADDQDVVSEYRVRHKNGEWRWLLCREIVFQRDEEGKVQQRLGTATDITQRRQAEEALRNSEARYRLLADHITDWVTRINVRGEYLYVSPSVRTLLGYTPEEMLGKTGYSFMHPEDRLAVELPYKLLDEKIPPVFIYRMRHKAGHYIWLETQSQIVYSPETGEIVEIVSSSRDITQRKQAEEELRTKTEEEREFQNYLKALHEITLELAAIDDLDTFYRQAVTLGLARLGFERLGLLLYEPEQLRVQGTYGTDTDGRVVNEYHLQLDATQVAGILKRSLMSTDRFFFDANVPLLGNAESMNFGWNAVAVLWNGNQSLGWLSADNGVYYKPVSKPLLDILALYSLTLGTLLGRKQLEAALRASEEKFRRLLEAAPVAIVISDQRGKMMLVNDRAESLFGYDRAELIAQPIEILVPESARRVHVANRTAYTAAPRILRMGDSLEVSGRRKDGSAFPAEIELSYIQTQSELMVMSFILDITERKRAADALREQRDFLQLVINSVPDLILVKDRAGQFQMVNTYAAQLYGITPDEMLGKTDMELNGNLQEVAFFLQKDQEALDEQKLLFIPEELVQSRYYQTSKIPLPNAAGDYDRLLVVASDITARKQAEDTLQQALQKEKELGELKSRFVSMASHEFRTPLATILALTETLRAYRHKLTDDQIGHRLIRVQEQVDHLKDIMEDVLQLARLQARRTEFNPTWLDLDALCRSVVDEFASQPGVGERLLYTYDATLSEVYLDRKLMRQIINNLVSNGIKYSPPDKPIRISLGSYAGTIRFCVQDEGMGIPTADQKHLFEPFHRAENVGTIAGTGLGLTITKESVELHHGSITVESQVDVGTTFTVSIPLQTREEKRL